MVTTFRLQHRKDGIGLFHTKNNNWENWSDEHSDICEAFENIDNMSSEFKHIYGLKKFKCAFKSFSQMMSLLNPSLINYLKKHKINLVRVEGPAIVGETQVIYTEKKVRVQVVDFDYEKLMAEEEAKNHMRGDGEAFDFNDHNFLIID